jgi:hypothetical protein
MLVSFRGLWAFVDLNRRMSARRMCACGDTGGMYIHAYVTDGVYAATWRIGYLPTY